MKMYTNKLYSVFKLYKMHKVALLRLLPIREIIVIIKRYKIGIKNEQNMRVTSNTRNVKPF
jgi:hypothetical protein